MIGAANCRAESLDSILKEARRYRVGTSAYMPPVPQVPHVWKVYESFKRRIEALNLSAPQYAAAIIQLADALKI